MLRLIVPLIFPICLFSQVNLCSVQIDSEWLNTSDMILETTLTLVDKKDVIGSWIYEIRHYQCGRRHYMSMITRSGEYLFHHSDSMYEQWWRSDDPGSFYQQVLKDSSFIIREYE